MLVTLCVTLSPLIAHYCHKRDLNYLNLTQLFFLLEPIFNFFYFYFLDRPYQKQCEILSIPFLG